MSPSLHYSIVRHPETLATFEPHRTRSAGAGKGVFGSISPCQSAEGRGGRRHIDIDAGPPLQACHPFGQCQTTSKKLKSCQDPEKKSQATACSIPPPPALEPELLPASPQRLVTRQAEDPAVVSRVPARASSFQASRQGEVVQCA